MEFRPLKLLVDYDAAWYELTDHGQNAWVGQKLLDGIPEQSQQGIRQVEFELVMLEEFTEGLSVLNLILLIDGLRMATAAEATAFSLSFQPPVGQELTVHALGSAFFNSPDEYPEEMGWFARLIKYDDQGRLDFWLESVMPRGGQLSWPAGTVFLAVRD